MDMDDIRAWFDELWPQVENFAIGLIQPWRLYQLGLIVLCFIAAHFAARTLTPRIEARLRTLEGTPRARLRFFLVLLRRLRLFIFVVLVWTTVLVLQNVTWPSRSFIIAVAAELATAWLFVGIATRLIRNQFLRVAVRWGAWAFVTVHILGYTEEAETFLDNAAVTFGETRISALVVLKAAVTLTILMFAAAWITGLVSRRMAGVEDVSPTMRVLTEKLVRFSIYTLAVVLALQAVGFDLTNLAVLSGAIGLGIGFGLQKVVSNLISGVILLLDKSIKPGDVISLGETFGWIQTLGARYVSVVTRDGREYLIPNEDLITGQVVNWSHSSDLVRLDIHFGVTYDADPHQVRKIAVEAVRDVARVSPDPATVCHVTGFGDSSVDYILRFWIRDPSKGLTNIRGAVFLALWDALKENDIEIPFPKRDVTIMNPEALKGEVKD